MYRYPVRLTLKAGGFVEGVALDTQRDDAKNECIKLNVEDGKSELIILDDIEKLEVRVDNPHFSEITFN